MMFEDLFAPCEVDEMLRAAKALSSEAPKEDRVMFSGTDAESSQVGVHNIRPEPILNTILFTLKLCVVESGSTFLNDDNLFLF